ncbi:MAG TPA: hypothetical protein PKA05_00915 [Roseiflexaceae bacterium]|nr:hypothetical protein [Roseiflexaceae bacterium]HMP38916.1 hypothetical protein [Roseiflexaceae bacterium]
MHASTPIRLLTLLFLGLLAVACGPEAPPRATTASGTPPRTTTTPLVAQPASVPTSAVAAESPGGARTLGDPAAPIVVVEFSDYQ